LGFALLPIVGKQATQAVALTFRRFQIPAQFADSDARPKVIFPAVGFSIPPRACYMLIRDASFSRTRRH
jgi:hypothetical protein